MKLNKIFDLIQNNFQNECNEEWHTYWKNEGMKEWNGLMLPRRRHAAKIPENMQRDGIAKAALHFSFFIHVIHGVCEQAAAIEWVNVCDSVSGWASECVLYHFFPLFSLAIFTSLFAFFSLSPSYILYTCVMLCVISVSFFSFSLIHFWLSSRESSNVGCWHNMLIFTNIILFAAKAFSADSYLLCARNICRITYAVLGHVKTNEKKITNTHTHANINLTLLVRFNATFTIIHFTCFAWQKIYL